MLSLTIFLNLLQRNILVHLLDKIALKQAEKPLLHQKILR